MSMRAFNFLKKVWTFYIFYWYSLLNEVAIATMTKLPKNQSIRDLSKVWKSFYYLFIQEQKDRKLSCHM